MVKAVVFDLDDTLISEKEYIRSGFRVVSSKVATDYKLDTKSVYDTMINLFNQSSKNVFNRLLDEFNVEYRIEYIKELIEVYRTHMPEVNLYEDGKEIIEYLYNNGLKLGIITDGYEVTQKNKLEVLDIDKYFECIVVTDELGREYWKPHRKAYDIVKEKLGVKYEEMIYVGDNVNKDFVTANELGIKTILIHREDGVYSEINIEDRYKAKYEIRNLNEIKDYLN